MSKRRPHCPLCVSNKVVPIMYGMPSVEMWEESKLGKFELGGCCISEDSPKWHCQACGHEFGSFLPRFDDLELPEPDGIGIKPLKLEFSIGGYTGPHHSVKFENGVLKYKLFDAHPDHPEKELEIIPTGRKWLNFRKKLDAIDVWKWKRNYVNPDVCDGTQWELLIDYGIRKKKTYGSNCYPGYADQYDMSRTTEFKALLHALELLLGGVKIG